MKKYFLISLFIFLVSCGNNNFESKNISKGNLNNSLSGNIKDNEKEPKKAILDNSGSVESQENKTINSSFEYDSGAFNLKALDNLNLKFNKGEFSYRKDIPALKGVYEWTEINALNTYSFSNKDMSLLAYIYFGINNKDYKSYSGKDIEYIDGVLNQMLFPKIKIYKEIIQNNALDYEKTLSGKVLNIYGPRFAAYGNVNNLSIIKDKDGKAVGIGYYNIAGQEYPGEIIYTLIGLSSDENNLINIEYRFNSEIQIKFQNESEKIGKNTISEFVKNNILNNSEIQKNISYINEVLIK